MVEQQADDADGSRIFADNLQKNQRSSAFDPRNPRSIVFASPDAAYEVYPSSC